MPSCLWSYTPRPPSMVSLVQWMISASLFGNVALEEKLEGENNHAAISWEVAMVVVVEFQTKEIANAKALKKEFPRYIRGTVKSPMSQELSEQCMEER